MTVRCPAGEALLNAGAESGGKGLFVEWLTAALLTSEAVGQGCLLYSLVHKLCAVAGTTQDPRGGRMVYALLKAGVSMQCWAFSLSKGSSL